MNELILGDNLDILRKWDSDSVDLIYLDPPFFSNRTYEVIWGDKGEVRSFEDRWSGGIDHYIAWLKERVVEMHRILKPTGSIFLHCDDHAESHIEVLILDKIFGENKNRSKIIWKRSSAHNDIKQGRKELGNIIDTIWYYSKSDKYTFNPIYTPYDKEYIEAFYKYKDPDGRLYRLGDLTGPGGAAKGNPKYEVMGVERYWRFTKENMQKLIDEERVIQTKPGAVPAYKRYLDEMEGVPLQNLWTDLKVIGAQSAERIGYPTQKPESLLERIIKLASNPGDIVMDPFVGGGTTIAVADRLGRQWVGIDQSVQAVKVTEFRLNRQQGKIQGATADMFAAPFTVRLHKYDYDTLRYKDAFAFETWVVQQYGGYTNTKQRGDMGMDGRTREGIPIQVKRSDDIGRNPIDNFKSACERFDKKLYDTRKEAELPVGVFIAFSFSRGAVQEVARLKNEEGVVIELLRVDQIVPIAKKPVLTLKAADAGTDSKGNREISFTASGSSEAGIEFYAWQWAYDESKGFRPDVLIDKDGQQTHAFKPGMHSIACKVVDNDGLEALEVLRLKVNGGITTV